MIGVSEQAGDEVQSYAGPNHDSHGNGFCVFITLFQESWEATESFKAGQWHDLLSICEVSTENFMENGSKSREGECVGGHLFRLKDDSGIGEK